MDLPATISTQEPHLWSGRSCLTHITDASRFLAQSQSRISFRQPEESTRSPLERPRRQKQTGSRFIGSRYAQRPGTGSHFSNFPFASRANAQAPLFYSATDEFREEDDEAEHAREVADFYALQRSRRQFVNSRLEDSSEVEDDGSRGSGLQDSGDNRDIEDRDPPPGGIRSSWTGDKGLGRGRKPIHTMEEVDEHNTTRPLSASSSKGQMYDVGLESAMDDPPGDLAIEMAEEDPPSIQQFRKLPQDPFSPYVPQETDNETRINRPPPPESDTGSVPPTVSPSAIEPPRHDAFWGSLYLICLVALFSSFLLVYLHTSAPGKSLGDTVYTTLHSSFYLLAVDTLVAAIVSLLWLALLRSYVRPLIYTILIAVPVILFSFSLYPFISSFGGAAHDTSLQDKAMRWLSSIPGVLAIFWVYGVYKGRHSFGKAIGILEFACKILTANPALLMLGFATLGSVILWTWIWVGMFTRVFLGGHLVGKLFIIDLGTWWLGVFFVLVYLWTLGVESGIQRATTAATVSQWYFHRLVVPAPTSGQVVQAALSHSFTTLFGTICLSTLLMLLVRLPVLVLPRRLIALVGFCSYTLLPNSIMVLTHPTTLTYSAIHSQPLAASARAVSQLSFMNPASAATAYRFQSRRASSLRTSSILPYNLALLLLHATRLIASFAFGFGAWVSTARQLTISGSSSGRGSLYAYVVGLIAGAIGWGVLGAMEGVLTGVVDAVVVCWASEVRNGEVKYCREAGFLLGDGEVAEEGEGLMGV